MFLRSGRTNSEAAISTDPREITNPQHPLSVTSDYVVEAKYVEPMYTNKSPPAAFNSIQTAAETCVTVKHHVGEFKILRGERAT